MRKVLCVLLLIALLFPVIAAASEDVSVMYVNNPKAGDRLNLRTAPNSKAASLGKYYTGVRVELLGESRNGYQRVSVYGEEGWMDARYLCSVQPRTEMIVCTVANGSGTGANLRARASGSGNVLALYPNGTQLQILGVLSGDWCHVLIGQQTGFVRARLLSTKVTFHSKETQTNPPGSMYLNSGNVNVHIPVYALPDAASPLTAEMLSGCMVVVDEFTPDGWARIWAGNEGWVRREYCVPLSSPTADARFETMIVGIPGRNVPLYASPGTVKLTGYETPGNTFHVEAVLPGGWVKGWTDNISMGYIQSGYLFADVLMQYR